MRCHEASEWMSLRLDRLLDAQEEGLLDAHLATCQQCRAEWESMQRACAVFYEADLMMAPAGLQARIVADVRRRNARVRLLRGMLLAFLALLVGGTLCVPPLLQTLAISTANPSSLQVLGEVVRAMVEATRSLLGAGFVVLDAVLLAPVWAAIAVYLFITGLLAAAWLKLVSQPDRLAWSRLLGAAGKSR